MKEVYFFGELSWKNIVSVVFKHRSGGCGKFEKHNKKNLISTQKDFMKWMYIHLTLSKLF